MAAIGIGVGSIRSDSATALTPINLSFFSTGATAGTKYALIKEGAAYQVTAGKTCALVSIDRGSVYTSVNDLWYLQYADDVGLSVNVVTIAAFPCLNQASFPVHPFLATIPAGKYVGFYSPAGYGTVKLSLSGAEF